MWILTTTGELVNADQVTSICVKNVTDAENTSGSTSINDTEMVAKKALVAGLINGNTSRLVTFDEDVDLNTINAYTNVIKHGIFTNVGICDLSVVRT
jgi:hypothetical protein